MQANGTAVLTEHQVDDLHRRYRRDRDPETRRQLVERYQGLARSLALKAAGPYDELDDLVQVALYALVQAVDRFDPDRGVKFSTFGWSTISGELKRFHRDRTWSVHVPRSLQEMYLRVRAVQEELHQELQRSPTMAEIAARTGDDEMDVIQAVDAGRARRPRSLDLRIGDDGDVVIEVPCEDGRPDQLDDEDLLRTLLGRLSERERTVLIHRFFEERTQTEIADLLGCSQMQVSRTLTSSLGRLRAMLDVELAGVPRGGRAQRLNASRNSSSPSSPTRAGPALGLSIP